MAHTLDSKDARITAILDDRLFLGDMTAALNPTMLRARGITHVVNASNGAAPNKFSSEKTQIARAVNSTQRSDQLLDWPVKYINVDIDDSADADIAAQFDRVCHWIAKAFNRCSNPQDQSFETASAQTPAVLVHCMCGVSRSATLLLAYLVKHESFTLREAWDLVKGANKLQMSMRAVSILNKQRMPAQIPVHHFTVA